MKPVNRWLEWLSSRDRRRAKRQESPRLVAHYWDGAAPSAHNIRDISSTGIYLLTEQRWYPGTVVTMSLQKAEAAEGDPDRAVMVNAKVVRSGTDGVGLSLILPEKQYSRGAQSFGVGGADRKAFRRFLDRLFGNRLDDEHFFRTAVERGRFAHSRASESDEPLSQDFRAQQ